MIRYITQKINIHNTYINYTHVNIIYSYIHYIIYILKYYKRNIQTSEENWYDGYKMKSVCIYNFKFNHISEISSEFFKIIQCDKR